MLRRLNFLTIKRWQTTGATFAWSAQQKFSLQDNFKVFISISGAGSSWKLHFMERHGQTSRIRKRPWPVPPPMLIATSIGGNYMSSFALCFLKSLHCDLKIPTRPTCKRYNIMSTRIPMWSRRIQMISAILDFFRHQRRKMAKIGMPNQNLPPRSVTLMRVLDLEMTWMILKSAET